MAEPTEYKKPAATEDIEPETPTFYDSKLFRWITLGLYLSGVSGMGMCLSLYYILFFDSTMPEIYLRFPITVASEREEN